MVSALGIDRPRPNFNAASALAAELSFGFDKLLIDGLIDLRTIAGEQKVALSVQSPSRIDAYQVRGIASQSQPLAVREVPHPVPELPRVRRSNLQIRFLGAVLQD